MAQAGYLFAGTALDGALERRRAYARVFDPPSRRILGVTGLMDGWRCLQVDAGEGDGQLGAWMAAQVGPSGSVLSFASGPPAVAQPGVETRTEPLRSAALQPASFDLIHGRAALIQTPAFTDTLAALLRALRPGGWLVLEEPDFSAARAFTGSFDQRHAFTNVNRARETLFRAERRDFGFGARLPGLLQAQDLEDLQLENDAPLVRGGSALAALVVEDVTVRADAYRGTGLVSSADLDHWLAFAADPSCWAVPHATIRGAGRSRSRV